MADVRQAIYSKLSGTAAVTALVSTRIYPMVMPQQPTMPAVVYQLIDAPRVQVHGGQTTGLRARFQMTCWGDSVSSCVEVSEVVRLALIGMSGSVASVTVLGVTCEGETEGYEPDTQRFYLTMDFFVWHREAAA